MRKAIAIPYVIALILGVIAIGILAYWFISQSSKTTAAGISTECQAKRFSYCVQWQGSGGVFKPTKFTNWGNCPIIADDSEEAECKNLGISK